MRLTLTSAVSALLVAACATTPTTAPVGSPAPAETPVNGSISPMGAFGPPPAARQLRLALPRYRSGETVDLSSLRGNVLLVDFWATWCGPCHAASRAYQRLFRQYGSKGLQVFGVSVDDKEEPIASFLAEQGVTYSILRDPNSVISGPRLDIIDIPVTVLVDRHGAIRFTHSGFEGDAESQIQTEVAQLLAEP